MYLRKFQDHELILTNEEAQKVLAFFFGESFSNDQLTKEDIGFAQALLIEAIETSNKISFIDDFMRKFMWQPPASYTYIRDVVKFFIKKSVSYWWKESSIKEMDLEKVMIYESVRNTIAQRFRSVVLTRKQSGELIY
ncbi:MAG TPA: hypothetical protein VD794_07070 [Flavisolibacter sp.]|nr:hypothetical protein [Flavisolibacter sp.]